MGVGIELGCGLGFKNVEKDKSEPRVENEGATSDNEEWSCCTYTVDESSSRDFRHASIEGAWTLWSRFSVFVSEVFLFSVMIRAVNVEARMSNDKHNHSAG